MSQNSGIIQFFSEDTDFELRHSAKVGSWLINLLRSESIEPSYIEYIFCSDEYLLAINKKYLNHDYYTDIISFPIEEDPLEATIYISVDRVSENANELGLSFSNELHRVMAHGTLHLVGYLDKTEKQKKEMRKKENEYLSKRPDALM